MLSITTAGRPAHPNFVYTFPFTVGRGQGVAPVEGSLLRTATEHAP